jgi:hypothetical protein
MPPPLTGFVPQLSESSPGSVRGGGAGPSDFQGHAGKRMSSPFQPVHQSRALSPHAPASQNFGAWGATPPPPKQKLSLKASLQAAADNDNRTSSRNSLHHIQREQEQNRAAQLGEVEQVRSWSERTVSQHHSPTSSSAPTDAAGQSSVGSFLLRSSPQVIPGRRSGKKGRSSLSSVLSFGSPNTSAWSTASGMASSEEGRSSFREIQLAEEHEQRELGLPAAGSMSPGHAVWMPLPGDHRPVGRSLRAIEEEELARRGAERRSGGRATTGFRGRA